MFFRSRYLWILPGFLDIVLSQEAFIIVDLVVGSGSSGQKWSLHDSSITIIYNLSTRLQSERDQWGGGGGGGEEGLDQTKLLYHVTRWRGCTTGPEGGCWTRWGNCTTGPEGVLDQRGAGLNGLLDQRCCWTRKGAGPKGVLDQMVRQYYWTSTYIILISIFWVP